MQPRDDVSLARGLAATYQPERDLEKSQEQDSQKACKVTVKDTVPWAGLLSSSKDISSRILGGACRTEGPTLKAEGSLGALQADRLI